MAQRHWVGGTGNWSDAGLAHWSLTNGGAAGQAVPSASDDVFFDSGSGSSNVTLDTAVAKVALSLTVNGFTGTLTFNIQLSVSGSITFTTTGFSFAGATTNKLRQIASGTWTTNGMTIPQDLEMTVTGTITVTLAGALTTTGDLLLNSTTGTTFSGAFNVSCATCTVSNGQTVVLTGHLIVSGLTSTTTANVFNTSTSKELQTASLTVTGAMTGTAAVRFTGGGTWTGATVMSNSVFVDGDTALSGTVLYAASGTPTLTLNGGSLTTGGTLSVATACTFVGHATKSIFNLTITAAITVTINTTALIISNTLAMPNAAVTFAGTTGFTADTWNNTALTAARTYTLTQGNTYTVNGTGANAGLRLVGTASFLVTVTSSHASNKVVLTLALTACQAAYAVEFVRVDATGGQTITLFGGTTTSCFNVGTRVVAGQPVRAAGGETLTVAGVTYDNAGAILGSCTVILLRENGDDSVVYWGETVSNASTGAYTFSTFPGDYRVYAYKAGSPDVFDVTDAVAAA